MILEFSCSNHKSIKDRILFSTLAGSDTTYEEKTESMDDLKILKSAIIYGANGSGKSNFIDAISFMKNLVMNSIKHQPGQGIRQTPHKLEGFEHDSEYKIQFAINGIRYMYGFTLKNLLVKEEVNLKNRRISV